MKPTLLLTLAAAVLAGSSSLGCRPRGPRTAAGLYTGPTQSMQEVVAEINANNAPLQTMWADLYVEANFPNEGFINSDGTLLYKAPRSMRLAGTKPGGGTIFEVGSSEDRYWLSMAGNNGPSRMWWGWHRNTGKPCVDTSNLPIRPELILEVLGITTINTNFLEPPVPVMRFNNDRGGTYMFVWNMPAGNRWAAQKEIWYDRVTKLPRAVFLFDADGRVVLRATLSRHEPVDVPGVPEERRPRVARLYSLFFPDTGGTMSLELRDVAPDTARNTIARRGIVFPEKVSADEVIQLDKACAD
jgi:hypothetical protein